MLKFNFDSPEMDPANVIDRIRLSVLSAAGNSEIWSTVYREIIMGAGEHEYISNTAAFDLAEKGGHSKAVSILVRNSLQDDRRDSRC